jgi:sugar/nucleoside kinase (ribokinase family)
MLTVLGPTTIDIFVRGVSGAAPVEGDRSDPPVIVTGDRVVPSLGGSGGAAAYVAASLGEITRLWSAVGSDVLGDLALKWLEVKRVDTTSVRIVPEHGTSSDVMIMDGADALHTYRYPGPTPGFVPRVRQIAGGGHDWLLVAGYSLLPGWRGANTLELLKNARRNNLSTGLDFGPPGGEPVGRDELAPLLPYTSVVFCTEAELELVTGLGVTAGAQRMLSEGASALAVKQPPASCVLFHAGAKQGARIEGRGGQVAGPRGASEAFDAGFIFAHTHGSSLEDAAQFANAVAYMVARSPRGIMDAPTGDQVRAFLGIKPDERE